MLRNIVNYKYLCMVLLLCVLFECLLISDANPYINSRSNFKRYKRNPNITNQLSVKSNQTLQAHNTDVIEKEEKHAFTDSPTSNSNGTNDGTRMNSKMNSGILRSMNTEALLRGFYVFFGLGAIVVVYIVIRTIRFRRKKTTVRKYGILANREDVEMTPLGAEDDDEDTTLFDANNHTRP